MEIKVRFISFLWGFCEATFFFFVPDIWLSRIVLEDKKEAYINVCYAILGALFGGSALYFIAMLYFEETQNFLALVPGISNTMIEQTGIQIRELGLWTSLFTGIISGVPYKIYAFWSGYLGLSFGAFILASTLIRALRFTVITVFAHVISIILQHKLSMKNICVVHGVCWVLFYIIYFYNMGF